MWLSRHTKINNIRYYFNNFILFRSDKLATSQTNKVDIILTTSSYFGGR